MEELENKVSLLFSFYFDQKLDNILSDFEWLNVFWCIFLGLGRI